MNRRDESGNEVNALKTGTERGADTEAEAKA